MAAWANANQGFVMAILTLVYVVATIVIAAFSLQANRTAKAQLSFATALEHARLRPYIGFTIEVRGGTVWAVLRNTGLSGAFDVKISVEPRLERNIGGRMRESGLTKHRHAAMPPGTIWEDLIHAGPEFFEQFPSRLFEGSLTYRDDTGKQFNEPVVLDLALHDDLLYTSPKSVAEEIAALRETLAAQARS